MIEFRPLAEEDLAQVEEWLARPHVARWWRDEIADTLAELRAAIEGRDASEQHLILLDGRPIGLIQTYLAADHPEWEAIVQVGPGVAGVDLFVGEEELIGRGLGPRIIDAFAREIVLASDGVDAVIATVEEANRRSWRAFEKAGFRHVRDVVEDGFPCRLLRLDRGAAAASGDPPGTRR